MKPAVRDLAEHLASLARLLDLEHAEERARHDLERSSLSLEARQERGHALLDLKAADQRLLAGRVLVELSPAHQGREIPAAGPATTRM